MAVTFLDDEEAPATGRGVTFLDDEPAPKTPEAAAIDSKVDTILAGPHRDLPPAVQVRTADGRPVMTLSANAAQQLNLAPRPGFGDLHVAEANDALPAESLAAKKAVPDSPFLPSLGASTASGVLNPTASVIRNVFSGFMDEEGTLPESETAAAAVSDRISQAANDGVWKGLGADPRSTNAAAQLGRGMGMVASTVPAMVGGLPLAVAQMTGGAAEQARFQAGKQLRESGITDPEVIRATQDQAEHEAGMKALPGLALYMVGGKLVGSLASSLAEKAGFEVAGKTLASFAGATISNVAVGSVIRALEAKPGERLDAALPKIENLTADTLFAVFHGWGEYGKAREQQKQEIQDRGQATQDAMWPYLAAREAARQELMRRGFTAQEIENPPEGQQDRTPAQALVLPLPATAPGQVQSGVAAPTRRQDAPAPPATPEGDALREQAAKTESTAPQTAEALRNKADATDAASAPPAPEVPPADQVEEIHRPEVGLKTALRGQRHLPDTEPVQQQESMDLGGQPAPRPAPPSEPVVAPAPEAPAQPEAPTESQFSGKGSVPVPLDQITLSEDVPQFKRGADEKGVVEPLQGAFDPTGVAPIQLWRRLDGRLEVISGRHRFDLAQRSGEKTIQAQIHDEAAGFDQQQAARLDAELNIRDENGSTSDYASYFRHSDTTEEEAVARGLLGRAKGRAGFRIAKDASESVFALHQSGRITDAQAESIAGAAPGNDAAQQLGLRIVLGGGSAADAANAMKAAVASATGEQATQGDFFSNTGLEEQWIAQGKVASQQQRALREQISAVQGAARKPAVAAKLGVDVKDPAGVQKRIGELRDELHRWEHWPQHPDLVKVTRGEAEPVPAPAPAPELEMPAPVSARPPEPWDENSGRAPTASELNARLSGLDTAISQAEIALKKTKENNAAIRKATKSVAGSKNIHARTGTMRMREAEDGAKEYLGTLKKLRDEIAQKYARPDSLAPEPAPEPTPPKLRRGERQGDLLSGQTEDLSLVGEKAPEVPTRSFGDAVQEIIDAQPEESRFGSRKVWLQPVFEEARRAGLVKDRADFDAKMGEAMQKGEVTMTRADFPPHLTAEGEEQARLKALHDKSAMQRGNEEYHFATRTEQPEQTGMLFSHTPETPENAFLRSVKDAIAKAPTEAELDSKGQRPTTVDFPRPDRPGVKVAVQNTREAIAAMAEKYGLNVGYRKSKYVPAVRYTSGRIVEAKPTTEGEFPHGHKDAEVRGYEMGERDKPQRGFTDSEGNFLTLMDIARSEMAAKALRASVSVNGPEASPEHLQAVSDAVEPLRQAVQGVRVRVLRSREDAPASVRDVMDPNTVYEGVVDPDTGDVYLFANNIRNPARAAEVFRHEVVGHYGVEKLVTPEQWDGLTRAVQQRSMDKAVEIGRSYVKDAQGKPVPVERWTQEDWRTVTKEYVARVAENPQENPGFWRQVVQAVRNALRKLGFVEEWSEADIRDLILRSNEFVKSGKTRRVGEGGVTFLASVRDLDEAVRQRSPHAEDIEDAFHAALPDEDSRRRVDEFVAGRLAGSTDLPTLTANERAVAEHFLTYFAQKAEFAKRNGVADAAQDGFQAVAAERPGMDLPERMATYSSEVNRLVTERTSTARPASEGTGEPTGFASTKNAHVDEMRAKYGLPPAMEPARFSNQAAWDEAMRRIDRAGSDVNLGRKLVEELLAKPRSIDPVENALLVHREITLRTEFQTAARAEAEAMDNNDPAGAVRGRVETARITDELQNLFNATKRAGTEAGRNLQVRQMMAAEDYSLETMILKKRAANGGKSLDPKDNNGVDVGAEVKAQHQTIMALGEVEKEATAASEDWVRENHAQAAVDEVVKKTRPEREGTKKAPKAPTQAPPVSEKTKSWIQRQVDAAKARTEERARQTARGQRQGSGIDPDQAVDDVIIGAGYIANGILEFSAWAAQMVRDLGERVKPHLKDIWDKANAKISSHQKVEEIAAKARRRVEEDGAGIEEIQPYVRKLGEAIIRGGVTDLRTLLDQLHPLVEEILPGTGRLEVMDAFSGYGKYRLLSKDPTKVTARKLAGEAQQLAKIGDMLEGNAPKNTGTQRREKGERERVIEQGVNKLKKEGNYEVTDPETQLKTLMEAITKRLKNTLKDLTTRFDLNERGTREETEYTAEQEHLRAAIQRVRETLKAVEEKPAVSMAERVKAAKKALQKSIDELNRRFREDDYLPRKKKAPVETPELKVMRAELKTMRAEFAELRLLDEEVARQRGEKRENDLANQIDELNRRLDDGDYSARVSKERGEPTPDATTLKTMRDELLKKLNAERREANRPVLTEEQKQAKQDERALRSYMTRIAQRTHDLEQRTAYGDFSRPVRRNLKLDEAATEAQVKHQRAKDKFEEGLVRDRLNKRTGFEKLLDEIAGWSRALVLTGLHTIGKLTTAAGEIIAAEPLHEAAKSVLRQVPGIKQIAAKAPRHGSGLNLDIEIKAMGDTVRNLFKDFNDYRKTGKTDLDVLYGDAHFYPFEVKEIFGRYHGALKTPARRNEFVRSYEKRLRYAALNGEDITSPIVKHEAGLKAYKDAMRSIFSDDNRAVDAYKRFLSRFNQEDPETGHVPTSSKVFHTTAKVLVPIIRIPTNIVARTLEYQFGLIYGLPKAAVALRRGVETLPEEHADVIMAMLARGSIGAAVFTLGALLQNQVGGYYSGKRDDKAVPYGAIRKPEFLQDIGPDWVPLFGGKDFPKWAIHNPVLEQLQVGATFMRAFEKHITPEDRRNTRIMAYVGATLGGLYESETGVLKQTPMVDTPMRMAEALKNQEGAGRFLGQLGSRLITPAIVREIAQYTDRDRQGKEVHRKPKGFANEFQVNIPGYREDVPKRR